MRGHDRQSDLELAGGRSAGDRGPVVRTDRSASTAGQAWSADNISAGAMSELQHSAGNKAAVASMAGQRQQQGQQPTVQRMLKKMKDAVSGGRSAPQQENVRVGDETLPMTRQGAFYVFRTPQGGRAYIHDVAVVNGVVNDDLAPHVMKYRMGGLALYRGIPRHHETWHDVNGAGVIPPLGSGELPDYLTNNTSFIPFSPSEGIARAAAVATRGMAERNRAEYVRGYTRSNENFFVGLVATVVAGPNLDVGFFNGGEVQIRGPVRGFDTDHIRMSTDVQQALTGTPGNPPEPISENRPATPTDEQKKEFEQKHGQLP
ncbi:MULTISPECIES: hypothetical protein [Streptomyces]|uniref:hypothetical protein n=1 Tax=Streptomyces TaxID=1883 RepID=UPI000B40F61C|nr:hypothetical protein [Streptomyces sp. CS113]OWA08912.1 hypothetical protein B9W62_14060 [Streptomyces sp. CS113]